jgi:hypothetical protein
MASVKAIVNRAERRCGECAAECIEGEQYRSRASEIAALLRRPDH